MNYKENIERFEYLMGKVDRPGIDKLMHYIMNSDFYTAPASSRFHLSCEGGLLQHSLNVHDCLFDEFNKNPTYQENDVVFKTISILGNEVLRISEESGIIVSLLHDICKTNFYEVSYRNVKNEQTGKWEKAPYYTINDKVPYGHGEKSVMMIESMMPLTSQERYAIRWHMAYTEGEKFYNTVGRAIESYPLIWFLHDADMKASKFIEDNTDNKIAYLDPSAGESAGEYANQPVFQEC